MSSCPSGSMKWELNVANIGILGDDVRLGPGTVVRLGLGLKRQNAVSGLGVPRLPARKAAVERGSASSPFLRTDQADTNRDDVDLILFNGLTTVYSYV